MASYLRPRRGKKATAVSQLTASAPLKRGEIFFEVPDTGVGTGTGKIKMGDGTTAYDALPYFMVQPTVDYTNAVVAWTNTTAASSAPYTDNATYAGNIIPSASLKTIFTNLKKLLLNYNSQLTTLNNDLAGYGSGTKVAAKATSATSATYSSTANYAKASAGATTASKATSATSATYSSTANYAKAVPSTVASRLSAVETNKIGIGSESHVSGLHFGSSSTAIPYIYQENDNFIFRYKNTNNATQYANLDNMITDIGNLKTSFQGGCNTIMQAVTAKGSTPASNSPSDIAAAIAAIPSIASGTLTGSMSDFASVITSSNSITSSPTITATKTMSLTAGKTYLVLSIATGSVAGGYHSGDYQSATYANVNWKLTSVTLSTNSSNTIQNILNRTSIAVGNGTISYRLDRITATVNQTLTASASVSGHYKPSVSTGLCIIYAQ